MRKTNLRCPRPVIAWYCSQTYPVRSYSCDASLVTTTKGKNERANLVDVVDDVVA